MEPTTEERLMDAALALYLERGWQGAALSEIAGRAGFTTGAIYRHFKGKNELFAAVLDRELRTMDAEVTRRLNEALTPRDRLQVLRRWFLERRDRAGVRLFYDLWHQAAEHPRLRKTLASTYERMTADVARQLERYLDPALLPAAHLIAGQSPRGGAETLAILGTALMEGLLLRQFLTQREDGVALVFDLLERLVGPT